VQEYDDSVRQADSEFFPPLLCTVSTTHTRTETWQNVIIKEAKYGYGAFAGEKLEIGEYVGGKGLARVLGDNTLINARTEYIGEWVEEHAHSFREYAARAPSLNT
jgi:hypothetical protein